MATSWTCSVCGYVHQGERPPETCPLCGAERSVFEQTAQTPRAVVPVVSKWECAVCGYEHEGPNPPNECPLCGAGAKQFKPAAPAGAPSGATGAPEAAIVIIGAGVAGVAAAEAARLASPTAKITLLSAEKELPYYRLNLTRYLAGEICREDLPMHPADWYTDRRIDLRLGAEAVSLDLDARAVALAGGERLGFDRLVLAGGAHPFVPATPGADLPGVMSVRTVDDADRLLAMAAHGRRVLVLGGGLLGLETAGALARRAARVCLLESHGYLMPQQLDRTAAGVLGRHLCGIGVELLSGMHVKSITGNGTSHEVALEEGNRVEADVIVLATGVRSSTHLARQAKLEVGKGVVVDSHMATSNPAVLAAGDISEHQGTTYGNWAVAQAQGKVAGHNAASAETGAMEFCGVPRAHTLKVLGLDTFSIGQFNPTDGSYRQVCREGLGEYQSFVFRDGVMVGANLVGDGALAGVVRSAIEKRRNFAELLAKSPTAADVAAELGKGLS